MKQSQTHSYEFGDFRLDTSKRLLLQRDGGQIPLTPKVFDTLLYLVEHAGKIIEKDELMSAIWADTIVEENNLSQNISILRRVLGEKRGEHRFIATIPGHGFKFVAEVSDLSVPTSGFLSEPSAVADGLNAKELQISNDKLQIENQSGISNLKLEIPDLKLKNKDQKPKTENRNTKRFGFVALIVSSVLALGYLGFYLWRENTKPIARAPIKTVAVLPFKPLVLENRDEAWEMGMADTLISRLGGNREIVVRPLSSVRKYGNLEQDALTAGHALDVEALLDGSFQRWGDKIRVNARLIKVADGTLLWTGTFDEKFTDVFVVQDAISNRVASALEFQLGGDEKNGIGKSYTKNAEAYDLYLRGRYYAFKITEPEIRKAIAFYGQAIELDLTYALAYAGMADAYRTLAITTHAPSKEVCPQAKSLALQALEIDANLTEAHIVLGWIAFWYEWDWNAAESELKRAIELAPNNSDAHRAYAHLLSNSGRHTEAVAMGRRARELDPLSLITNALEGQFLFYAGRTNEAIARYDKTLEIEPNFWVLHNHLGRVYTHQGRYTEAITALTKAKELSAGSTEPITQLGYALAKSGNREKAQATLADLKSLANKRHVPAYNFAMIYNGLGEKEEALNYLEKSFEEREVQLTFIKVDTRWDDIRVESRFVDLMRRMKLQ